MGNTLSVVGAEVELAPLALPDEEHKKVSDQWPGNKRDDIKCGLRGLKVKALRTFGKSAVRAVVPPDVTWSYSTSQERAVIAFVFLIL